MKRGIAAEALVRSVADDLFAAEAAIDAAMMRIALERHRDLLNQRAPGLSGTEMMRSIFLLAFGLPPSERSRTRTRAATAPARMAA